MFASGAPRTDSGYIAAMNRILMVAILAVAPILASGKVPRFAHLAVGDHVVRVQNSTRMKVSLASGFRLIGPHNFTKQEENGYHFEVSLASYVSRNAVISVAAERLVEAKALNYDELSPASWPDSGFLSRSKGCAAITPEQAAAMPVESGMQWIVDAGFEPSGSFAFEAALLVAPDRRHEASIELIAPVASCTDAIGIEAALQALRARVTVTRAK